MLLLRCSFVRISGQFPDKLLKKYNRSGHFLPTFVSSERSLTISGLFLWAEVQYSVKYCIFVIGHKDQRIVV